MYFKNLYRNVVRLKVVPPVLEKQKRQIKWKDRTVIIIDASDYSTSVESIKFMFLEQKLKIYVQA